MMQVRQKLDRSIEVKKCPIEHAVGRSSTLITHANTLLLEGNKKKRCRRGQNSPARLTGRGVELPSELLMVSYREWDILRSWLSSAVFTGCCTVRLLPRNSYTERERDKEQST